MPGFYYCTQFGCSKSFKTEYGRDTHVEVVHPVRWFCTVIGCSKSFKTEYGRDAHMEAVHKRWGCTLIGCRKSFRTENGRDQHMKAVHRFWGCTLIGCGRSFRTENGRDQHMEAVHNFYVAYVCGINNCLSTFDNHKLLMEHKSIYHSFLSPPAQAQPPTIPSTSDFICCDCNIYFTSEQAFNTHLSSEPHVTATISPISSSLSTTTGQYSHKCTICSHTFPTRETLSDHTINSHYPQRLEIKFKCPSCSKEFAFPSLLLHLESGVCFHVNVVQTFLEEIFLKGKSRRAVHGRLLTPASEVDEDIGRRLSLCNGLDSEDEDSEDEDSEDEDNGEESGGVPIGALTPSSGVTDLSTAILTPSSSFSSCQFTPAAGSSFRTPIMTPTHTSTSLETVLEQNICPWPVCYKKFKSSYDLMQHLHSPVHAPRIYQIPEFSSNSKMRRRFKTASGMLQHLWSVYRWKSEKEQEKVVEWLVEVSGRADMLRPSVLERGSSP
ncbi:hypothetical protein BZA77DRAFT_300141 [Pyronema omphalodes]|nr:hypothetical protein BZA77DRAFT_300141 [Pyronema omphalodes]